MPWKNLLQISKTYQNQMQFQHGNMYLKQSSYFLDITNISSSIQNAINKKPFVVELFPSPKQHPTVIKPYRKDTREKVSKLKKRERGWEEERI